MHVFGKHSPLQRTASFAEHYSVLFKYQGSHIPHRQGNPVEDVMTILNVDHV